MSETAPDAGADWRRIEELFHAALELPPEERSAWVEQRAYDSPAVRAELGSLLAAEQRSEELSRTEGAPDRHPPDLGERLIGEFCGPYRLDRLIGQGGMAWVYEGVRVQGDFRQRVAVKVLPAVFGEAMNERFRQEKQILAELGHPGIARLLDGGVSRSGLSYLAMEYVEGQRISEYVKIHVPDRKQRIRLFLKVCDALEFAHQRRVIHRDLKPANILVAPGGQPKLLDFGIARLLDQDAAPAVTIWRAYTPGYASPEQLRGEPAGVATDVYQLGVLLEELLTGRSPGGSPAREPREADGLRKEIGADLAAAVAKATNPEIGERYSSVAVLAADLRRYLQGLPLAANRGDPIGRAAKFVRRHALPIGLLAILGVAAAGALYEARVRAARGLQRATDLYQVVSTEGQSIEELVVNHPARAMEIWRRLRDSVELLRRDDPDDAKSAELLAQCYLRLGELAWFRYGPSLMDPDAALESYAHVRDIGHNRTLDHRQFLMVQDSRMFESEVLIEKGRGADSFAEAAQVLNDLENRRSADPASHTMSFLGEFASFYDMLSDRLGGGVKWPEIAGNPPWFARLAALRPYRATDWIAEKVYRDTLASSDPDKMAPVTRMLVEHQLGRLEYQAGRRDQGLRTLRQTLRDIQAGSVRMPSRMASIHLQLGDAAGDDGRYDDACQEKQQAVTLLQTQFEANRQNVFMKERLAEARLSLAQSLERLGRHADAAEAASLGLQALRENAAASHAAVVLDIAARHLLTVEPASLRDSAVALEFARRAVNQTAGQMPPYLATLAFAQEAAGMTDAARRSAEQAIADYDKLFVILKAVLDRYPEATRLWRE